MIKLIIFTNNLKNRKLINCAQKKKYTGLMNELNETVLAEGNDEQESVRKDREDKWTFQKGQLSKHHKRVIRVSQN